MNQAEKARKNNVSMMCKKLGNLPENIIIPSPFSSVRDGGHTPQGTYQVNYKTLNDMLDLKTVSK